MADTTEKKAPAKKAPVKKASAKKASAKTLRTTCAMRMPVATARPVAAT